MKTLWAKKIVCCAQKKREMVKKMIELRVAYSVIGLVWRGVFVFKDFLPALG